MVGELVGDAVGLAVVGLSDVGGLVGLEVVGLADGFGVGGAVGA